MTAFKRSLTLAAWSRDPKCVVGERTLGHRVRAGWPIERALTEPSRRTDPAYTIEGRTQRLSAWVRAVQCTVHPRTVKRRLDRGFTIEAALFLPPQRPGESRRTVETAGQ
ncbi:hypothetical protein AB0A73_21740 [Glycomyces sp. NPDC047369]